MKAEAIKIIVIDDDPFTLTMNEEIIRRVVTGGQTISFSSAADALEYLETENELSAGDPGRPGMILSDLHMPGIDGFRFLDEFAKLGRAVRSRYRVFILSSTTNEEDWAKLSEKTCFTQLCSKPLTVSKLMKLIRAAMGGSDCLF